MSLNIFFNIIEECIELIAIDSTFEKLLEIDRKRMLFNFEGSY